MLVRDCLSIEYDTIKEAVKKHEDNLEAICEDCLEDDCEKVYLPLKAATK